MGFVGVVNVPEELKQLPQWAVAAGDGKGSLKAPYTINEKGVLEAVSVHANLLPFNLACQAAAHFENTNGIGFVLKETDAYTCIDLDYKEGTTTIAQLERYNKIIETFDSYTEISVSGKGAHIWVKGSIGQGCRRDGIEVYSQERFIICTGNVLLDKPIQNRQELLDVLVSEIRNAENKTAQFQLKEVPPTHEDHEIISMAILANNSDKFNALCAGDWQGLGYPSQSEADLSLMSMLAFYSNSNEQCRRLFRMSALGKREKANKNNRYLDYCLRIIRSRQALEMQAEDYAKSVAKKIAQQCKEEVENSFISNDDKIAPVSAQQPHAISMAEPVAIPKGDEGSIPWPPGMLGEIASFIYYSSPRPVKEVSIVAALGFLAGLCGKSFCIPQSGLNLYVILVGRSGVGKEAMHGGPSLLLQKLREIVPTVQKFVDFADFASGPALVKACAANPSFVNIAGEFGKKLRRMAREDHDGPMSNLRTVMTNLYQKSGPASVVGGIAYSNKGENVASVSGVAYSMIGETTPGTLYESLTESMLEDGFLSRFTIVEYNGDRAPRNRMPQFEIHPSLLERLCALVVYSETLLARYTTQSVTCSPEAEAILDAFDLECDSEINSTFEEGWRQMWNRAHLKTWRIAALLAAADNHLAPVVQLEHVEWAMAVVRADIKTMARRIEGGDVGVTDGAREKKVLAIVGDYLRKPIPVSYNVPEKMVEDGVIPRRFIQLRVSRLPQFTGHKLGAIGALDLTIRSLIDSGYLAEVDRNKIPVEYGTIGKCYRITAMPQSV